MGKLKRVEGLNCETTAREGAAFVLRAKLDQMCSLRDAALDFSDVEGVHKMRVASRRLRSALRDFQPYLSKRVSPKPLKAVAGALGAVRDEDVAIETMEKLAAEADGEARAGIGLLAAGRRARREGARARLAEAIGDDALAGLREKFNSQLDEAAAGRRAKGKRGARQLAAGAARFSDVGGEVVRARFCELKESGAGLYQPSEVEPLHEIRIRAKRLRYAIELFTQCWGEPLAPFAAEVEKLQEYLGGLHDCDVWIADLGARLGRRAPAGGAARQPSDAAERRAAVWLLGHFARARAGHYGKALALWDGWEAMDFESGLFASVEEARRRLGAPAREAEAAKVD
jgi:CHAD domain-containing protein